MQAASVVCLMLATPRPGSSRDSLHGLDQASGGCPCHSRYRWQYDHGLPGREIGPGSAHRRRLSRVNLGGKPVEFFGKEARAFTRSLLDRSISNSTRRATRSIDTAGR